MTIKSPVQKILLFIDGSEECIAAAQYAIAIAKTTGAELKAIYVVNVSVLDDLLKANIFVKIEEMDYQQDLEQDGNRYLRYIADMGQQKGITIQTDLVKGVVNKEVVDRIEEWGIDLLVMGELDPVLSRTDAYHDESELIFRKARCSVLIVKDIELCEKMYAALESE